MARTARAGRPAKKPKGQRRARHRRPFHVVLLAGGSGTRFWPLSRARRPKQLLALAGPRPLLVETWRRSRRMVPADRIWVVAPAALAADVRRSLRHLRRDRLIVEPSPRDTGPAVTLACAAVSRAVPEAVVGVFPTDHVVSDSAEFVRAVRLAAEAARQGALVCLGVQPHRPATGFGYLSCASRPRRGEVTAVRRFVEKPDLARARRFVRSGRYLWNAGMFVWGVDRFLDEARRTAPGIVRAVTGHLDGKPRSWDKAQRLSVDYAVMEKARGVSLVPLDAGWDDVGSWDAACRLGADSPASRERLLLDSPGSVVFGGGRFVAVVGVAGVAVVDTPDALLIVDRQRSEGVKDVVAELRRRGRRDLL